MDAHLGEGRQASDQPVAKITVKLVGRLVHSAGFSERELDVPPGTTVAGLLRMLGIDQSLPVVVGRNGWAVGLRDELDHGDRVVIAPEFSGG